MNRKVLVLIIVLFFAGMFLGYMLGTYATIKAVVHIAGGFVSEDLVRKAIFQYNNHIGACYPSIFENASIHIDKGD